LLGLRPVAVGGLTGRVLSEALPNGNHAEIRRRNHQIKTRRQRLRTVVKFQRVLSQRYFDVAGFPGRTLGLDADKQKTAGK